MLVKTNVRGHDHSHGDGSQSAIDGLVEFARENATEPFSHSHPHSHADGHTHDHPHFHPHAHERFRRGAGPNHRHEYLTDAAMHRHYMLHELTHAFHLGSMVILTVLVLVTYFKMFIMGKKFLHHKIEVSLSLRIVYTVVMKTMRRCLSLLSTIQLKGTYKSSFRSFLSFVS